MNYESMTDRELDALVAEKVMGVTSKAALKFPLHYTAKLETAFRVVEAMRERGYDVDIEGGSNNWCVAFTEEYGEQIWVEGESLPRAICLAALRATDA